MGETSFSRRAAVVARGATAAATVTPAATASTIEKLSPVLESVERLVIRSGNGDPRAFSELYDITAPHVFGIVVARHSTRFRSEPVLRDVFLHLWQCAPQYDPATRVAAAWILAAAHLYVNADQRDTRIVPDRRARQTRRYPKAEAAGDGNTLGEGSLHGRGGVIGEGVCGARVSG